MKVFIGRQIPAAGLEKLKNAPEISVLEIWPHAHPATPEELRDTVRDCDGFLAVPPDRVDEDLLNSAPNLKVIANHAVGVDNIDVAACHKRKILVGNTPDVLTDSTADVTWALLMAAAWRVPQADFDVRNQRWGGWSPTDYWGTDVAGATLGIVGFGRIGQAMARRARGFGMQILYWNRSAKPQADELGATRVELDELLQQSDFVSLHCALTNETRNLIDAEKLALMKPSAILINTARGAVVDQNALVETLREKKIRGAGLDVFVQEPVPHDDPILALPNVVMMPHLGSATEKTRDAMSLLAAENILAGLRGEPLPHAV